MKARALAILSLFASTSTLLCCALPALLVALGFGAVVAGAVSSVPWLVPLSRHKAWVFLAAGLLLAANWGLLRRSRAAAACPRPGPGADPGTACAAAGRFRRAVLALSAVLYLVGFAAAFLAAPVGHALGGH